MSHFLSAIPGKSRQGDDFANWVVISSNSQKARNHELSITCYGIHLLILQRKKKCTPSSYTFSLFVWSGLEILFLLFKAKKYKKFVVCVYITVINETRPISFLFENHGFLCNLRIVNFKNSLVPQAQPSKNIFLWTFYKFQCLLWNPQDVINYMSSNDDTCS